MLLIRWWNNLGSHKEPKRIRHTYPGFLTPDANRQECRFTLNLRGTRLSASGFFLVGYCNKWDLHFFCCKDYTSVISYRNSHVLLDKLKQKIPTGIDIISLVNLSKERCLSMAEPICLTSLISSTTSLRKFDISTFVKSIIPSCTFSDPQSG